MEPIRLSALGRFVHVGDLYNYYNDSILPGPIRVLRQNVDINRTCEVESSFFLPDKFKRRMLGINSHLDQSIEGGSLGFERLWFAGYLEPTSNEDADMAQVDAIFSITRRTEELIPQYLDQSKMNEYRQTTGGKATHVVERVFYGAELIVSMRRPLDLQCESKASAEGKIFLAAQAYFKTIVQNGFTENEPTELDSVVCTIFSSIDAGNVRIGTVEDSCKLLRDAITSTNDEKWKPMEIILQSIPAQVEARLLSEKMNDVEFEMERQLAMLKTIVQESYAISKYPSNDRVPPLEKAMCQFLDLLTPLRKKIDSSYSQFYMNMEPPEQMLVDMKSIASLLTEMTHWLMHRRQEVEIMCSLLSGTNLPMSELEKIKSNASYGDGKRTRVLILKMDYAQDPLIDRLSKLLENRESFKTPVFWIATCGKHSIEHIAQLLSSFEKISSRCTSLGTCYQIGLVPFSSSMIDGKVITVAYSVGDHPEVAATESIQPSINSQEDQSLPSPSPKSPLFPPVKTSLLPTVYNHQQMRNVKQLGLNASIEEDCPAQKDIDRKQAVMAIPSTPRDNQQTQNKYSELGDVKNTKSERVTCTSSMIPPPANVRKKLFESTKQHDSMKQAPKQEPAANVHMKKNLKEKSLIITEKDQPTTKQNLPVAARFEKATQTPRTMKSAPPAQENLEFRRQASVIPKQTGRDGKVYAGSCGRGRGFLLGMDSTGRRSAQNYSGSSKIPSAGTSASGSATGPHCQSRMSGTNSRVSDPASTTSSSTQRKTEETKAGGGAVRDKYGTSKAQESSSYFNFGRRVKHPPGNANEFSSEEETEKRAKQPKKSGGPVSYFHQLFSRSPK